MPKHTIESSIVSKSEQETQFIASKIAGKIKKGGIVCLFGELGTGKTVFVKGLARALGLKAFSIKSPTYTYIREHAHAHTNSHRPGSGGFYHIDLYRLETVDEILCQTIGEILANKKNIVVIEWADRLDSNLPNLELPPSKISVYLEYLDQNSRKITIKPAK